MFEIAKGQEKDYKAIAEVAQQSFIESHGHSADMKDILRYVTENYNEESIRNELKDEKNIFHLIYFANKAAGYSKIIYDFPYEGATEQNITKLERIYLLKNYYGQKLGLELFKFNRSLSENAGQKGMWLYVWKENHQAIKFYTTNGFKIIGSHDFRISENHTNPNHQMFLKF